ncbi:hypothetical protein Tco_0736712 [Tanacetum coccineum]
MAKLSSHNPSSPGITPKEELVSLDKPKSLNPFLPEAFTRAPNQYEEYLSEVWYTTKTLNDSKVWISTPTGGFRGAICITTFRNALRAQYLPLLRMYVPPLSITTVRLWFATIRCITGGLDQISNKDATILYFLTNGVQVSISSTRTYDAKYEKEEVTINPTQVLSVYNLTLKPNQLEEPPFTDHMKAICNLDVPVDSKALNPSSQTEEFLLRILLTSLGATSEEGAHPQLSSGSNPSVLVDKTKFTGDGLKTTHTNSGENEESRADDISLKVKLEDLSDILKDTRSILFTHDSPPDESIIVSDESEEENEVAKDKDTEATSHDVHLLQSQKEELEQAKAKPEAEVASMKAKPSYPDINHLTKLLVTSLKPELSKLLASHDFASCLPTEPKELPSKITRLSGEIKELKKHVRDMEIELPGDLKEILKKLETFTSTISSLSSQVAELKNIQWELLAEFLNLPSQVSSVQKKLQTLDSLPSLLNKVTQTLDKFTIVAENASTTTKDVPSAGQATASPAEGEKNTKDADTNLKDELVDLLGKNVVTQYYTK